MKSQKLFWLLQGWFKNFMQKNENIDIVGTVFDPLMEDNNMTRLEASIETLKKELDEKN